MSTHQDHNPIPLDIVKQFAHHSCPCIPVFHLGFLKCLEETSNPGIDRNSEDHDGYADKGGPTKELVQRNKRQSDLGLNSRDKKHNQPERTIQKRKEEAMYLERP
jgi:hypothetical protein